MSFRLVGAVLALLAAVLLAASVVTSAWWSGHPEVDGRSVKNKTVYIGLIGSEGCNTGGDGKCAPLSVASEFTTVGFVELGLSGLLAILVIVTAIATLKTSERRKTLGKLAIVVALVCSAAAVTMIVIGPNVKSTHTIAVPIGYGMYLFWGAIAAAILGCIAGMQPPPKVRLRPSRQPSALPQPQPNAAPQIDVLALFQEDALRPSALAPPSPGGALAGPAGPLGVGSPPTSTAPLFNPAPQLRALYDADPAQGGTGGYVPGGSAPAPPQVPPSVHRSQVGAVAGIATPPPMDAVPRADTLADALANLPPPKPSPTLPPLLGTRTKAASVVPPPPVKPPSLAPLPSIGKVTPPKAHPTIATGVVPPPANFPPAAPDLAKKLPVRADTDPSDHMETIDRDAADAAMTMERPAESPDVIVGRPVTNKGPVTAKGTAVGVSGVGDSTDAQINLPASGDENTDVNALTLERPGTDSEDRETKARDKVDPEDVVPPPRPSQEQLARAKVSTPAAVAAVARDSASDIETIARERISASEIQSGSTSPQPVKTPVPITQAGVVARTMTPAPTKTPVPIATQPGVVAREKTPAPVLERTSSSVIPVSTAPDSLPPPKEAKPTSVGPTPACPQCEAPMAWVEEHLRFYCKSCRMYF